jgi:hypothetical protein
MVSHFLNQLIRHLLHALMAVVTIKLLSSISMTFMKNLFYLGCRRGWGRRPTLTLCHRLSKRMII